ncbi:MAG: ferric iron uptake transcriptional regulator [Polyangiales bacterium]
MRIPAQLNNVGLKATGPRLVVLTVFQKHDRRHLTAEDVHRWLVENSSFVGIATVYRVLNHLTDVGILSRTVFDAGAAVYELHPQHHHDHLICCECGRVDEFSDDVINQRSRSIARSTGYAIARHQLALYGYCPTCLTKQQQSGRRDHR